ncbi:MAG: ABC transporter permease [bacterium]|nr:ABC transporter permease [bacterium]
MTTFLLRRIAGALPLLLTITVISYAMMGLAPGGPTALMTHEARAMSPAARQHLLATLGLDKPWYVQYFYWLNALVVHGSLGYSYVDNRPVVAKILEKLPVTIELIGLSLIVTLLIAIPIGVTAARYRNSLFDHFSSVLSFAAYGIPVFWLGIVLIDVFSLHLRWLPAAGISSLGHEHDPIDNLRHMVLPVATLSFVSLASWIRYQRGAMLNVLAEPYIRTARSKGLSERVVIYRHALRNALMPTITLLGLSLPSLVGGAYFLEYVFSLPGMGYLGINSVFTRDYPTVMGITLLSAILVVAGNLIADLGYAVIDPRVRYE